MLWEIKFLLNSAVRIKKVDIYIIKITTSAVRIKIVNVCIKIATSLNICDIIIFSFSLLFYKSSKRFKIRSSCKFYLSFYFTLFKVMCYVFRIIEKVRVCINFSAFQMYYWCCYPPLKCHTNIPITYTCVDFISFQINKIDKVTILKSIATGYAKT